MDSSKRKPGMCLLLLLLFFSGHGTAGSAYEAEWKGSIALERDSIRQLDGLSDAACRPEKAANAQSGHKAAKRRRAAGVDRFLGKTAPKFELAVLGSSGTNVKLSEYRGRAVLLYFWASWAEPCKIEMPWLVELQQKYGGEGLQVLAVSLDNDDEQAKAIEFALTIRMSFPALIGTEQMTKSYGGVDALPETFFINRNGKIVAHEIGLESQSTLEKHIRKSLMGKIASIEPKRSRRPTPQSFGLWSRVG